MSATAPRTVKANPSARSEPVLDVEAVVRAIGIPLERWPGACHGIATAYVVSGLAPEGSAVARGHYRGPIAANTLFSKKGESAGFAPHSWVKAPDGSVIDPTRWVFEDAKPYVYVGEVGREPDPIGDDSLLCLCGCLKCEHESGGFFNPCKNCGEEECMDFARDPWENEKELEYDEGGNQLREQMMRPAPPYSESDRPSGIKLPEAYERVVQLLLGGTREITIPQAHWLANLPLKRLGDLAPPLFEAMIAAELSGLIPIDNRRIVLGR